MDCIFCRIIKKEIPAKVVFESENVLAFRDVNPAAPVHILVVPKRHIQGIEAAGNGDRALLGEIQTVLKDLAKSENLEKSGYRIVVNSGPDAGQAVDHVHYHVLGGRKMTWPPG